MNRRNWLVALGGLFAGFLGNKAVARPPETKNFTLTVDLDQLGVESQIRKLVRDEIRKVIEENVAEMERCATTLVLDQGKPPKTFSKK